MSDEVVEAVAEEFEENLRMLWTYGRRTMLLYRADTGDQSYPVPPEDLDDVPVDLRVEWIALAGGLGSVLHDLAIQVGREMERREPGGS